MKIRCNPVTVTATKARQPLSRKIGMGRRVIRFDAEVRKPAVLSCLEAVPPNKLATLTGTTVQKALLIRLPVMSH